MQTRLATATLILIEIVFCLITLNSAWSDEGYPYRGKYPDIEVIATEDLKQQYKDALIIDVRSKMEFDVIRIKKAIHMPISSRNFERDLTKKRLHKEKRSIVFYCNGHSCEKSYQATQKAKKAGLNNILCYDSGIFDWIEAYPQLSLLMGKNPSATNQIIPESEHQKRLISLQEFQTKADNSDVIVIDVRDSFQRNNHPAPNIKNVTNAPMDNLVKLIKLKKYQDKELLLFDAVGKQVKWLHYYLKDYGYTRFKFLQGGVGQP